jgi:hypothetical protein
MKKYLYAIIAILTVIGIVYAATAMAQTTDKDESGDVPSYGTVYECPMHDSDFMTTDPEAKCPECNMSLEKIDELYVCPDHPDEITSDPEAVCGETGNAVVPVEELYICPMHPDMMSTDPDAKCSQCGMDLVPYLNEQSDNPGGDNESAGNCHMSGSCCGHRGGNMHEGMHESMQSNHH